MEKRYASLHNPTVSAIAHAMYRFASAKEAAEQIGMLRSHFIIAKKQIPNPAHPSVILWIKGYEVTEDDKKKGIIGHFAVVTYRQEGSKFILYATKMATDINEHPQRGLVMRDNPNWGHPVLRSARKGKTYTTLEEVEAELALLHEHYPKVSIPNPGKLYIMIYCSNRPPKERMVKHILEIKANGEGRYFINIQENTPKVKRIRNKPPLQPKAENAPPQGYFTAKVALKRKRKPQKPLPPAENKD